MAGFLTPTHILLLLLVVLMLYGAKRLPELGRSLGSGMREFKHSIAGAPTPDQDARGGELPQVAQQPPASPGAQQQAAVSGSPPPPAA
jgi:sec-independent protein translocase protein TatA